jgi:B12-binding domain/radical SAM domain protein of rhizo-twelve system
MRIALVNPNWSFAASVFFGCPAPHLPLEFGYTQALLQQDGHDALLLDGHLLELAEREIVARLKTFAPELIIFTTAPSYLAWRCPPPELDGPAELAGALGELGAVLGVVGPHASTTPEATLARLGANLAILGEPEQMLLKIAGAALGHWHALPALAVREEGRTRVQGFPYAADMTAMPPLAWPREWLERHAHRHQDPGGRGLGAEVEASRGCPWRCAFCAKENFRCRYRRRTLEAVTREIDALIEQGVDYVFFIDEVFMPWPELLAALEERPVSFGLHTRLDLWDEGGVEALGRAGCVSLHACIGCLSEDGRALLDMEQRLSTAELNARLLSARAVIPHVEAALMETHFDAPAEVAAWRARQREAGIHVQDPVPLFPYPGSPIYARCWGDPDERAWERARDHFCHGMRTSDPAAPAAERQPPPARSQTTS